MKLVPKLAVVGEHLRYRTEADIDDPAIFVDSLYNLRRSRRVIELEAGREVSSTYSCR